MNDREKKLTFFLLAIVLLIGSMFLYTSYNAKMAKNRATFKRNQEELERMKVELFDSKSKAKEEEWLNENLPTESTHGKVSSDLAGFTEKSAERNGVEFKTRPRPTDEDPDEFGAYRSAVVRVKGSAMDAPLYRWLVDLQSPKDHRSITSFRIIPQRDDDTKVECELEVSQWFTPPVDEGGLEN